MTSEKVRGLFAVHSMHLGILDTRTQVMMSLMESWAVFTLLGPSRAGPQAEGVRSQSLAISAFEI